MYRWRKLTRLLEPGFSPWARTHVQNPFPEQLTDGRTRVHFASRDTRNRARGGWLILSADRADDVSEVSQRPSLDLGTLGAFDDCGVMPSSVLDVGGELWMYYTGWSKAVEVPFSFHIGLAISRDGGETFERYSRAPILGRTRHDPYIVGAPHVVARADGFKMWYVSCLEWVKTADKPRHRYTIKAATSTNGIDWQTSDELCIPLQDDDYAIARPFVFGHHGVLYMYYSYRGGDATYRIGLARSTGGNRWQRMDDQVGIDVSAEGWDSEMVCYATTFQRSGETYMLYNGNGYGATGLGLAIAETETETEADE